MSDEKTESLLNGLLRRSLVAPGFRPRTAAEEDAALEALGDVPLSPQQHTRMLQKINGELPCFMVNESTDYCSEQESEPLVTSEFAAMFKLGEGETMSEELAQRLRELEKEANELEPHEDEEIDEDCGG
jgi:Fe-S-cluster containining protein